MGLDNYGRHQGSFDIESKMIELLKGIRGNYEYLVRDQFVRILQKVFGVHQGKFQHIDITYFIGYEDYLDAMDFDELLEEFFKQDDGDFEKTKAILVKLIRKVHNI